MTWLRLRSSNPKVRQRYLAELGGRDAVRAAEEIVSTEWISTLEASTAEDGVTGDLLERERVVSAHAERKRARAAERDGRRLTTLIRAAQGTVPTEEAVHPSHADGTPGTA